MESDGEFRSFMYASPTALLDLRHALQTTAHSCHAIAPLPLSIKNASALMLAISRRESRCSWKALKPLILRPHTGICPSTTSTSLRTTIRRPQHHFSIVGETAQSCRICIMHPTTGSADIFSAIMHSLAVAMLREALSRAMTYSLSLPTHLVRDQAMQLLISPLQQIHVMPKGRAERCHDPFPDSSCSSRQIHRSTSY